MVKEVKLSNKPEPARLEFKKLLIKNPNYFGTFPEIKAKPVEIIKMNTSYEELKCIGFYPEGDLLEAIVGVKLTSGYGGDLCSRGTYEYVRFFVDWNGNGNFSDPGDDMGIVSFNVHDIPNADSKCLKSPKPLSYSVGLPIESKKRKCTAPYMVKVRAILSWELPPTAGNPNFTPVWGNVVDRWVQIKPLPSRLLDIASKEAMGKYDIEPGMLETAVIKPKVLTQGELKALYKNTDVQEHRFNFPEIKKIATCMQHDPGMMVKYKQDPAYGKLAKNIEWILAESHKTEYEQLNCVGLDYDADALVATLSVKLQNGYNGGLCTAGSTEYVAFWAYVWDQIEQMCAWTYLGRASVNVHDIKTLPAGGLQYAVKLPVDLSSYRDTCGNPRVIKVRAILSWQTPPSDSDPDYPPTWGNTIESNIQVRPGTPVGPAEQVPFINFVGGMAVSKISGNSQTTIPSTIGDGYANGTNALESPFGGVISICGRISHPPEHPAAGDKLKYRVQYKKSTEATWRDITSTFWIYVSYYTDTPAGTFWHQDRVEMKNIDGYYRYEEDSVRHIDGDDYGGGSVLADWFTPMPEGDGLYELRVLLKDDMAPPLADVPAGHVASNVIKVVIDNTVPDPVELNMDLGPCKKYAPGDVITGTFRAKDEHIWYYSIALGPYAAPAGQLTHVPPEEAFPALPAPGVDSGTFRLDTKDMKPCGYNIYLHVYDRTIRNNHMIGFYRGAVQGFCLLTEK